MSWLPYVLCMIPTVVLMWFVGAFRWREPRCIPIWVGIAFGMLSSVPIWLAETVVEDGGAQIPDLLRRAFVQQVLGAAVIEEVFIFVAFILTYMLFRGVRIRTRTDIVVIAVAAAIGFTTVENVMAILASPQPISTGLSRLLSIVAGHATLQLVMGYFAAGVLLDRKNRSLNAFLMFAVPIAIHGWGDFTEAVFQAVDPDSDESKRYFSYWIFGLFAYLAAAACVLFQLRNTKQPVDPIEPDDASDRGSKRGGDDANDQRTVPK
ncbi:MAG: PrsW family glutamic-type intramembrane protease [Rubripirellula sp.]